MKEYTIYCTEEQTKKALCLGAPIEEDYRQYRDIMFEEECMRTERQLLLPTAEQMLGWMEEQRMIVIISTTQHNTWFYHILADNFLNMYNEYASRKEATIAAIDAALDYLEKHKK